MSAPEGRPTPRLNVIAVVWAAVGGVALVVALIATSMVIAVFGGLAILAAGAVYVVQGARDRSVEREARLMASPPPPLPDEPFAEEPLDGPGDDGPRGGPTAAGGSDRPPTRPRRATRSPRGPGGPTARDVLGGDPGDGSASGSGPRDTPTG